MGTRTSRGGRKSGATRAAAGGGGTEKKMASPAEGVSPSGPVVSKAGAEVGKAHMALTEQLRDSAPVQVTGTDANGVKFDEVMRVREARRMLEFASGLYGPSAKIPLTFSSTSSDVSRMTLAGAYMVKTIDRGYNVKTKIFKVDRMKDPDNSYNAANRYAKGLEKKNKADSAGLFRDIIVETVRFGAKK